MTENPRTPETTAAAPAPEAAPALPAADAPPGSAPPPAAAEPGPPAPAWRRFGRWVTAAVLVGVLLVGGVGGFAIGRATAPEVTGPFGGERPGGGRVPDGGSAGELPEPPSDRSGQDSSGQGSASEGTTGDDATGTSATT
jgi:hypothetical protein